MIFLTLNSYGQNCDKYVKACEETVKAQDKAIDNLKKSVIVLKQELQEQKEKPSPLFGIVVGLVLGVVIASQAKK